jgi:hypothetical protein
MSTTANVKSIEALQEWKNCLKRFVGETLQLLQSAEQKIRRTEEWLQDRLNYWHHEVEQCWEEVRQAKRDLQECQADEDNDCSTEEEALAEAERSLREAEAELNNVRKWKAQVQETAVAYRVQAERLGRVLVIEMPRADAFLGRAVNDLHRYIMGVSLSEQAALTESIAQSVTDPEEARQLANALAVLRESSRGKEIFDAIIQRDTTVEFGYLPSEYHYIAGKKVGFITVAEYDPEGKTITVNVDFKGKPANVIAPYLAHEGTHVQWYRGEKKPSLREEYEAHKTQAEVWEEVKGDEHDQINEHVATIISLGRVSAMWKILEDYGDEYFSDFDK